MFAIGSPAARDRTGNGGQSLQRDPATEQSHYRAALTPLGYVVLRILAVLPVPVLALEYRGRLLAEPAICGPARGGAARDTRYNGRAGIARLGLSLADDVRRWDGRRIR